MRCQILAATFLFGWGCGVAAGASEAWDQYRGFNNMSVDEQRSVVAQSVEGMRDHYHGRCFRGRVKVTDLRWLSQDPFAPGKTSRVKSDAEYTVRFAIGGDRIRVEGSIAGVEDGRAVREKIAFWLHEGVAYQLFYSDGEPAQLTKACDRITIQHTLELRPLLWVTSPALTRYSNVTFGFDDDLAEAIQHASDFELQENSDGPDKVFVTWSIGEGRERSNIEVFELGDHLRWVRSESVLHVDDHVQHRVLTIEYGTSFGIEVPEKWSEARWKEKNEPSGERSGVSQQTLAKRQVILGDLTVSRSIPKSDYLVDVPKDVRMIDRCQGTELSSPEEASGFGLIAIVAGAVVVIGLVVGAIRRVRAR